MKDNFDNENEVVFEDHFEDEIDEAMASYDSSNAKKRAERRKNKITAKRRQMEIAEDSYSPWPGVIKNRKGEDYVTDYGKNNYKKHVKKQATRAARREKDIANGNNYKKTYDVAWELD